jgi:hypothetical protein
VSFRHSRQQDGANSNTVLPPPLRERLDRSSHAQQQIEMFKVLNLDYYPRESQVVTFRDPWSFPILYHPAASSLVRQHIADLAQKVVASFYNCLRDISLLALDCCRLRISRRIPYHPLLLATQSPSYSRISHSLLMDCKSRTRRDRHIRAMERKLSPTKQSTPRRFVHCRSFNGSSRTIYPRIHLSGHGS